MNYRYHRAKSPSGRQQVGPPGLRRAVLAPFGPRLSVPSAWRRLGLLGLLGLLAVTASGTHQWADEPRTDRWQKAIDEFAAQDRRTPPPQDAVLFVGSSSIRLWDLARFFPDWKTINRGFGGSQTSDVLRHYERLIPKYRPRVVVLYEGDNDIAAGKSPQEVARDYGQLVERIRRDLPGVHVFFLTIKPSIARWEMWPEMQEANRLIDRVNRSDHRLHTIDTSRGMFTEEGEPDPRLFVDDGLHLNDAGYALWSRHVREAVPAELIER